MLFPYIFLLIRHIPVTIFMGVCLLSPFKASKLKKFEVVYLIKVNSVKITSDKKVPLTNKYISNDTTIRIQTGDSMYVSEIVKGIKFQKKIKIVADKNESFTFFLADEDPLHVRINTPDTLIYRNNQWIRVSDNKYDNIKRLVLEFTETKEHKQILKYDCMKFLAVNKATNEKYTIWASKQLPNTLLPMTGIVGFKYGILEIEESMNKWKAEAEEIKID
jgi:hypothetical protein